ncbi:MAG TPA: xanthine dehydrogenase family protein subunit M [Ilumatobacteraceae bacterium]|nr:xanthine dehydrogenase family protein subunit M [Ilumatobacteraceae bacterium]
MTVLVPTTLDEALRALAATPGASVLAGGTDLMVEVNEGRKQVTDVVAVNRLPELRTWTFDPINRSLHLGAAITWREIEQAPISGWVPALAQAARTVGSPQIRHAGTVGGNLATSSPAGDGLPPLAALDAVVHVASEGGERSLPFTQFMTGPKRTDLQPGELVVGVTMPVTEGWQGFSKVGVRNAMVIANVSAALVVDELDRSVRLALGSVGPVILRCPEAEALAAAEVDFEDRHVSVATVARFAELARAAARPIDDHRSTAEYRRHAVGVLAARLLRRAFPMGAVEEPA